MSEEKNIFGGGNKNFVYTPMSEDEQEVIHRLVEADDLEIHVKQWGIVNKFMEKPRFGDKVIELKFWVVFSKPDILIPVHYFDLELRTRAGELLFAERQAIRGPDGGPLMVGAGLKLPLAWSIAIHRMDPNLVKAIKPGARGLTSREGNRHLNEKEQEILHHVRGGEKRIRQITKTDAKKATDQSVY